MTDSKNGLTHVHIESKETEISKKPHSKHNSLNSFSKDEHSIRYEDSIIINLIEQLKKGDENRNSQDNINDISTLMKKRPSIILNNNVPNNENNNKNKNSHNNFVYNHIIKNAKVNGNIKKTTILDNGFIMENSQHSQTSSNSRNKKYNIQNKLDSSTSDKGKRLFSYQANKNVEKMKSMNNVLKNKITNPLNKEQNTQEQTICCFKKEK